MKRSLATTTRVAVAGAGAIGREFAVHHFGKATSTQVIGVADADEAKAAGLAREVGATHAAFATLLRDADLAYIGTPPASHAALALEALAAGRHVLLEKPLAATSTDADAIVDAAEAAAARGVVLGVNIGMRYNAALQRMRKLAVEERSLGALVSGRLDLHFLRWPREWQQSDWVARRDEGGPLREVGTHFIFALLELFGARSVSRVKAVVDYPVDYSRSALKTAAEVSVHGVLQIRDGPAIDLTVRTDGGGLCDGDDAYELELVGESGDSLLLDEFTRLRRVRASGARTTLVKDGGYGRVECIEAVVGAAAADAAAPPLVTAREARDAQRVIDAFSLSGGAWINVRYD